MKAYAGLLLVWLIPVCTLADSYSCTFENGSTVKVKYSCEAAMIEKFGDRLVKLYPRIQDEGLNNEHLKNLYVQALVGCEEPFSDMTPEEIGKNGEPFYPWELTAAMIQAARDVACTQVK